MPIEALQKFRSKYPGAYDDLSDQELAQKLLKKYPEYQDLLGDVAGPMYTGTSQPLVEAPPPMTKMEVFNAEMLGQGRQPRPARPTLGGYVAEKFYDIAGGPARGAKALWGAASEGRLPSEAEATTGLEMTMGGFKLKPRIGARPKPGPPKPEVQGPPELLGPDPAPYGPDPAPYGPQPQRALPPGPPPTAMKALPPVGGTTTGRVSEGRRFVAGPTPQARVGEYLPPLPRQDGRRRVPGLPKPALEDANAATLRAAKELETGRPLDLGTMGRKRTVERVGAEPPEALPRGPLEPYDAGLPEGVGRAPGGPTYPVRGKYLEGTGTANVVRDATPPPMREAVPQTRRFTPPNAAGVRDDVFSGQRLPPGRAPVPPPVQGPPLPPNMYGMGAEPPRPPQPSPTNPPPLAPSGRLANFGQTAKRTWYGFSPDQYKPLRVSKEPNAQQLGGVMFREEAGMANTINTERTRLRETVQRPLQAAGAREEELGALLDRPVDPGELATLTQTRPELARAYVNARQLLNSWADRQGLDTNRRIKDYLPHTWDQEELRRELIAWLPELQAQGRTDLVAAVQGRLQQADGVTNFAMLPNSIRNPFLERRTGAQGYSLKAIEAMDEYIFRMAKKEHGNRVLTAHATLPIQDPALARHAHDLVSRFTGRVDKGPGQELDRALRNIEFADKLYLNPRWGALTNLPGGQMFNMAQLGKDYLVGTRMAMTPEGAKYFAKSGHADLSFLSDISRSPRMEKLNDLMSLKAGAIERANRQQVFIGEITKQLRKRGMGFEDIRAALDSGTIPQDIVFAADDAVRATQGTFGLSNPKFFEQPIVKAATQFGAVPAKLLQTFVGWSFRNPAKFIGLVAIMEAFEESMRFAGVQTGNAFGVGIDLPEAVQAIQRGDQKAFMDAMPWGKPLDEGRLGVFSLGVTGPVVSRAMDLAKTGKHAAGVLRGKPGAEERFGESLWDQSALLRRGRRVGEGLAQGPGGMDTVKEVVGRGLFGSDSPEADVRAYALQMAQRGEVGKAKNVLEAYAKRYGRPVRMDSERWQAAVQAGKQLDREREQARKQAKRAGEHPGLPARVQRALAPPPTP